MEIYGLFLKMKIFSKKKVEFDKSQRLVHSDKKVRKRMKNHEI